MALEHPRDKALVPSPCPNCRDTRVRQWPSQCPAPRACPHSMPNSDSRWQMEKLFLWCLHRPGSLEVHCQMSFLSKSTLSPLLSPTSRQPWPRPKWQCICQLGTLAHHLGIQETKGLGRLARQPPGPLYQQHTASWVSH